MNFNEYVYTVYVGNECKHSANRLGVFIINTLIEATNVHFSHIVCDIHDTIHVALMLLYK